MGTRVYFFLLKAWHTTRLLSSNFVSALYLAGYVTDFMNNNLDDLTTCLLCAATFHYQVAEDVSFAANGITAEGIKAFDGVLQTNIGLTTLNLTGNQIGDEGVKVIYSHTSFNHWVCNAGHLHII